MRIGLDLDNTLVCYDHVFLWAARRLELVPENWEGNRLQLRDYVRDGGKGEENWQRLQGKVYGKWIYRAQLYPGVYRFLWRCKIRGITVHIVSHKTQFGHFDDEKFDLRESAREFIASARIFSENQTSFVEELYFLSTRSEKLHFIAKGNYDLFIDDLPEIFRSNCFPRKTKAVIFDPTLNLDLNTKSVVSSWSEIEADLFKEWTFNELSLLARRVGLNAISSVQWKNEGRNSRVVKLDFVNGATGALKIYPDGFDHDRLKSESQGFRLLRMAGVENIPEVVGVCVDTNVAIYRWVSGDRVEKPKTSDVKQAVDFIRATNKLRCRPEFKDISNASAAIFSGEQLENQIQDRYNNLIKRAVHSPELINFLSNEFIPAAAEIFRRTKVQWPESQLPYEQPLSFKDRTLSPSDFGFHNVVKRSDGTITFLDFEYFGWDDPAKLIGDFVLHPGMSLSDDQITMWFDGMKEIFGQIVLARTKLLMPYLGLCWCLILLNEFRQDYWIRRLSTGGTPKENSETILNHQLQHSRQLLFRVKSELLTPNL